MSSTVTLPRTLNDRVAEIHFSLYENEEYMEFLYAVYDEQAVEGSLATDDIMAAKIIRAHARQTSNVEVGRQKLATIVKALGVTLRHCGEDRKTRRNALRGEVVPSEVGSN